MKLNGDSELICQQALELPVGIVQAGAQCALRDVDEFGNLWVGKPLDIAEVHYLLVGRGKLGNGACQFTTQVFYLGLTDGVGFQIGISQLGILLQGIAFFIIVQAEASLTLTLAQVVAGVVQGNGVEPGVE